jgi:hypothetical protein
MNPKSISLGAALFALSSPALADHVGPSSVGPGGGLSVFTPDTLDAGHASVGFRLSYSRPEQRSDQKLEALAAQDIHAHNTDYNLNASLGVAYGITHHLTVSAELPYVRRDDLREGEHSDVNGQAINEVARLGSPAGIGDLNVLAKYRLTEGEGVGFAVIGGIKVPTGSTHKRSDDGERLETEHQPGTGSWDPLFGATAATSLGAVRLTASALYQLSTNGAQNTRLGNRLQGGVAVSHRFAPADHHYDEPSHQQHHHADELDEHAEGHAHASWDAFVELGGEWEGRQKVDGETEQESGGKWLYVAPGARFISASGWSAAAAVAVPVWEDIRPSHPNNRYRMVLSLGRSF